MQSVALALIDVCLLEVVVERFHDAVVDQQGDEDDSCDDCDDHCHEEDRIRPYFVACELVDCVVHYGVAADEAEHVDQQLAVHNDIDQRDAGCRRQGLADDWHQSHVNDHEGGDVSDLVVVVRPLYECEQREDGDEDEWYEDGERIHDGILVEGNVEGNDLVGTVRVCIVAQRFLSSEFFALD